MLARRRFVGRRTGIDAGCRDRRLLHGRRRGDTRADGGGADRWNLGDQRGDGRGGERTTTPETQEVGAHVVGGLVAVIRILGERGEDDLLEVGGNVGVALRRWHRFFAHVLVRDRDR